MWNEVFLVRTYKMYLEPKLLVPTCPAYKNVTAVSILLVSPSRHHAVEDDMIGILVIIIYLL